MIRRAEWTKKSFIVTCQFLAIFTYLDKLYYLLFFSAGWYYFTISFLIKITCISYRNFTEGFFLSSWADYIRTSYNLNFLIDLNIKRLFNFLLGVRYFLYYKILIILMKTWEWVWVLISHIFNNSPGFSLFDNSWLTNDLMMPFISVMMYYIISLKQTKVSAC